MNNESIDFDVMFTINLSLAGREKYNSVERTRKKIESTDRQGWLWSPIKSTSSPPFLSWGYRYGFNCTYIPSCMDTLSIGIWGQIMISDSVSENTLAMALQAAYVSEQSMNWSLQERNHVHQFRGEKRRNCLQQPLEEFSWIQTKQGMNVRECCLSMEMKSRL